MRNLAIGILILIFLCLCMLDTTKKADAQVDANPMTEYTGQKIVRQLEEQNDLLKQILEQTERINDKVGR